MTARFSRKAVERFTHPRNYGELEEPDSYASITGPCGDTMEFWLHVDDGLVSAVGFTTTGCGPSCACGSMCTELAEGKTPREALRIKQQDILEALGGMPEAHQHCALLASNTLKATVENFMKHQVEKEEACQQESCSSCDQAACSSKTQEPDETSEEYKERQELHQRLCRIRHKIIVMSGKGGVGKSTVAVNLATALMLSGKRVGLLDIDIHGPSVPTLLGLENESIQGSQDGMLPVELGDMKVMSLGFLIRNPDDAIIWRGPMKIGVIKQFLKDIAWGDLDYLIIDSPPGTGDEVLSACQLIEDLDGAVVVTTPQKLATIDVRKSVTFCRQLHVPVLGIIENMSGFICPKCNEVTSILQTGGGEKIATDMKIPFLGAIPMDPQIAESCDNGKVFVHHYKSSPTAAIMRNIITSITDRDTECPLKKSVSKQPDKEKTTMRIAIPLADGKLAMHFGHCSQFAMMDVDLDTKTISSRTNVDPPPHEPGLLPPWLAEQGANMIIAGGMGSRAQDLFTAQNIEVLVGAPAESPEKIVSNFMAGELKSGENVCDH
ncbi:MAG: P-loop NTPase [Candidatus Hydrogenedentes bacterium]|nr:P-loop NTPase [Candidatus Hydrogenedentota bacterium]